MKMKYKEIAWAEMKPDCYGGEDCDEVIPQWWEFYDGDTEDDEGEESINFAAKNYPPGAKITVTVPLCPKCDEDQEMHNSEDCDFDWSVWTKDTYQ